jgi:putative ABC exporter
VIAASLYITVCSARNRLRLRLRRLREPRYLLGGIVGVAYFYFSFFVRARGRASAAGRRGGYTAVMPAALAAVVAAGPVLGGLALLLITIASWMLPGTSGLLSFSEAEVQFLFPAPVPRRQLLVHRILRSQLGLLLTSLIVAVATPSVAGYARVRLSIAAWVLLTTAKISFAGITMARGRLTSASGRARRAAWMPVAMLTAAAVIVAVSLSQAFAAIRPGGLLDLLRVVRVAGEHGLAGVVLWPFVTIVRPLFAASPLPYLTAQLSAAVILVLCGVWVLRSDEAFQDAAAASTERRVSESREQRYRVGSSGWTLAPAGRLDAVFAWKAAMQTFRFVDPRVFARGAAILAALALAAVSLGRAGGLAGIVGIFATVGTLAAILFLPQVVRIDMRQDLQHLETLKTWPIPPAAVVRGELLWPGAIIAAGAWLFEAAALTMSSTVFTRVPLPWRLSAGVAIAIVAPALIFAQLIIHNGVALMFPAWIPLGSERPRGLDAMGQRLIMLAGTWFLLGVMTLPGAIAGAIVWFAASRVAGAAAVIPGAIVCALAITIEVLLATEVLAPLYERIDITSVERPG